MTSAFVSTALITSSLSSRRTSCAASTSSTFHGVAAPNVTSATIELSRDDQFQLSTPVMSGRRDLKKEKRVRNLEFSRVHRKRPVKNFNRRAAQEALTTADNLFLSSIYGTIRFRSDGESEDVEDSGNDNGNKTFNKRSGSAPGGGGKN